MTTALVPLADGCEEIEAVTIIDLLRRAGVDVTTAGLTPGIVTASRGVKLEPDTVLDAVMDHDFDLIVLPGGGGGADRLRADARILDMLKRQARAGRWLAAICAAPKVLAAAGLLDGRQATSFPGHLEGLEIPDLGYSEQPVVRDGNLLTSRGPGTAMDFALALIEVLEGAGKRDEVEAALQRPAQATSSDWVV